MAISGIDETTLVEGNQYILHFTNNDTEKKQHIEISNLQSFFADNLTPESSGLVMNNSVLNICLLPGKELETPQQPINVQLGSTFGINVYDNYAGYSGEYYNDIRKNTSIDIAVSVNDGNFIHIYQKTAFNYGEFTVGNLEIGIFKISSDDQFFIISPTDRIQRLIKITVTSPYSVDEDGESQEAYYALCFTAPSDTFNPSYNNYLTLGHSNPILSPDLTKQTYTYLFLCEGGAEPASTQIPRMPKDLGTVLSATS